MNVLTTNDLTLIADDKLLVKNLNVEFRSGQNWAVLGPNGSGKTTLLHALAGLTRPRSGNICYNNRNLDDIPDRKSVV